jgi:superfamily I DNA and RNA helicase
MTKRGPKADLQKIEFYKKRLVQEGAKICAVARELNVSRQAAFMFAHKHFDKKTIWEIREENV